MSEKKYILCDCCQKKIYFGEEVYYHTGYCGTYCSAECYAECWGDTHTLTEEFAEDNSCTVYNDNEIQKQIDELKQQKDRLDYEIETLQRIIKQNII